MQTFTLNIRTKRQTTIPKSLLQQVGLKVGDKLVATIKEESIILKPQKKVTLDLLKEIQKIVKESGVSEKEMQDSIKKTRKEIYEKRYSKGIS